MERLRMLSAPYSLIQLSPSYRNAPTICGLHCVLLSIGLMLLGLPCTADEPAFELREHDRIGLLGGTFIERLQSEGFFETALTTAFPRKHLTFRNLGWSGDTVWGDSRGVFGSRDEGFQRLVDDTLAAKPTVLVIAYGHNEAFAGEAGIAEFRDGLQKLLNALAPSKARFVLVAPPKAQPVPSPLPPVDSYNRNLALYRDAIRQVAREQHAHFIDWYNIADGQTGVAESLPITDNGLHWTDAGEWLFAPRMAKSFGASDEQLQIALDVQARQPNAARCQIKDVVITAAEVKFTVVPASLPPPMLPLTNAEKDASRSITRSRPFATLQVTGLAPAMYDVHCGDRKQLVASDKVLAAGLELRHAPDAARVGKLRDLIREKNALFFYRYRPQNETYLFLFRKHEQGNNAVEIPQFDPLIEAKEQEIANFRVPQDFTMVIRKK